MVAAHYESTFMSWIRDVQQKSHAGMTPVLAGDTPARLTILKGESDISDETELDTSTVGGTRDQSKPPFQSPNQLILSQFSVSSLQKRFIQKPSNYPHISTQLFCVENSTTSTLNNWFCKTSIEMTSNLNNMLTVVQMCNKTLERMMEGTWPVV
jgi:hypothetical protein